jgi:hypothetical protein
MNKSKDKGRLRPFVPLDVEVTMSPAWRATSFGARLLYIHLKRRWSFKQKNNGRLFLSHRDAQEEIGGSRDSISRWFRELQHYGFIIMTSPGCLGVEGKGKAPRWRLTELEALGGRNGNTWMPPTKDFNRWDGTKFRDDRGAVKRERERRRRRIVTGVHEKQNPGPQREARVARKQGPVDGTSGPQTEAIGNGQGGPQTEAISRSTTRAARGRGNLKARPDLESPDA